eukprot:188943_1
MSKSRPKPKPPDKNPQSTIKHITIIATKNQNKIKSSQWSQTEHEKAKHNDSQRLDGPSQPISTQQNANGLPSKIVYNKPRFIQKLPMTSPIPTAICDGGVEGDDAMVPYRYLDVWIGEIVYYLPNDMNITWSAVFSSVYAQFAPDLASYPMELTTPDPISTEPNLGGDYMAGCGYYVPNDLTTWSAVFSRVYAQLAPGLVSYRMELSTPAIQTNVCDYSIDGGGAIGGCYLEVWIGESVYYFQNDMGITWSAVFSRVSTHLAPCFDSYPMELMTAEPIPAECCDYSIDSGNYNHVNVWIGETIGHFQSDMYLTRSAVLAPSFVLCPMELPMVLPFPTTICDCGVEDGDVMVGDCYLDVWIGESVYYVPNDMNIAWSAVFFRVYAQLAPCLVSYSLELWTSDPVQTNVCDYSVDGGDTLVGCGYFSMWIGQRVDYFQTDMDITWSAVYSRVFAQLAPGVVSHPLELATEDHILTDIGDSSVVGSNALFDCDYFDVWIGESCHYFQNIMNITWSAVSFRVYAHLAPGSVSYQMRLLTQDPVQFQMNACDCSINGGDAIGCGYLEAWIGESVYFQNVMDLTWSAVISRVSTHLAPGLAPYRMELKTTDPIPTEICDCINSDDAIGGCGYLDAWIGESGYYYFPNDMSITWSAVSSRVLAHLAPGVASSLMELIKAYHIPTDSRMAGYMGKYN